MNKEIFCVLVTPKKYKEIYKQTIYMENCIPPLKTEEKYDYGKVETFASYPIEISYSIEEDMMFVSKEEYNYYKKHDKKEIEKYMRDYVSDEEFKAGW